MPQNAQEKRSWRQARLNDGLCPNCTNHIMEGRSQCATCIAKKRVQRARKRPNGLAILFAEARAVLRLEEEAYRRLEE